MAQAESPSPRHTGTDWRVESANGDYWIVTDDVLDADGLPVIIGTAITPKEAPRQSSSDDEIAANAVLMAGAPRMHRMIVAARRFCIGRPEADGLAQEIDALLAALDERPE